MLIEPTWCVMAVAQTVVTSCAELFDAAEIHIYVEGWPDCLNLFANLLLKTEETMVCSSEWSALG